MKSQMSVGLKVLRGFWPWILTLALGLVGGLLMRRYLKSEAGAEDILWRLVDTDKRPWKLLVIVLVAFAGAVGFMAFHLHRRRSAAVAAMRDVGRATSKCAVYGTGGDRLPSGTRIAIEADRNPWRS